MNSKLISIIIIIAVLTALTLSKTTIKKTTKKPSTIHKKTTLKPKTIKFKITSKKTTTTKPLSCYKSYAGLNGDIMMNYTEQTSCAKSCIYEKIVTIFVVIS